MKILGIDYGTKKIGLAFSDSFLAEPLLLIKHDPSVMEKILKICRQYEVEMIVVGLPEGELAPKIKKFAEELLSLAKLPIILQDETLTSQDAVAKMISAGAGRKKRREYQDAVAAALILQNYLDNNV